MDFDGDDLAGVVDLFGALTRAELDRALSELDFRAGEDDPGDHGDAVRRAVGDYYLVEASPAVVEGVDASAFVAGPVAFPRLPDHAGDLPHLLDVPDRTVDREALAGEVASRLRDEAAAVAADGDSERAAFLLNVTYDAEAWAPLDLSDARETLDGT